MSDDRDSTRQFVEDLHKEGRKKEIAAEKAKKEAENAAEKAKKEAEEAKRKAAEEAKRKAAEEAKRKAAEEAERKRIKDLTEKLAKAKKTVVSPNPCTSTNPVYRNFRMDTNYSTYTDGDGAATGLINYKIKIYYAIPELNLISITFPYFLGTCEPTHTDKVRIQQLDIIITKYSLDFLGNMCNILLVFGYNPIELFATIEEFERIYRHRVNSTDDLNRLHGYGPALFLEIKKQNISNRKGCASELMTCIKKFFMSFSNDILRDDDLSWIQGVKDFFPALNAEILRPAVKIDPDIQYGIDIYYGILVLCHYKNFIIELASNPSDKNRLNEIKNYIKDFLKETSLKVVTTENTLGTSHVNAFALAANIFSAI